MSEYRLLAFEIAFHLRRVPLQHVTLADAMEDGSADSSPSPSAIGSLSARLPPPPCLQRVPGADPLLQQRPLPQKSAQTLYMTATHSLTRRQTLTMSTTNLLSEPSVLVMLPTRTHSAMSRATRVRVCNPSAC